MAGEMIPMTSLRDGNRACRAQVATKSKKALVVPVQPPPCWSGDRAAWLEYRSLAIYTATQGFTYCSDCEPGYQKEMIEEGRCKFPGTTFKRSGRGWIGTRKP